ncbi:hypothetical protein [Enterococcus termitis]|uniref:Uncharacterized protein n=1 Tax=Enterococcus termitis TaxID=332950 RepID=A0A1E5GVX1_9ENTE|nr:hypothetical protein [Enterococcus termitis]OEG16806.1 hypothetical protein BCR25_04205 [Enterococcus termitis]
MKLLLSKSDRMYLEKLDEKTRKKLCSMISGDVVLIEKMLIAENLNHEEWSCYEMPIYGEVYCCENRDQTEYFAVEKGYDGVYLMPTYITNEVDENGYNNFPCKTLKESIEKNKLYK